MSRSLRPLAAVVLAAALGATACTAGHGRAPHATGAPALARPAGLYVAVGASETTGVGTEVPLRQSWPKDLFRTMPPSTSFVNLGISGATVAQALTDEVPRAEQLRPTVVTVWLNVNDLIDGVTVTSYQTQLEELVRRLRAGGAAVYVANTPPLDHLPVYLSCEDPASHPGPCPPEVPRPLPGPAAVNAAVDAYNAAIAQVVATEGAVLVDLHAAGLRTRAEGREASLISADGFHPNAVGAQAVADAFAAAVRRAAPAQASEPNLVPAALPG